MITDIDQSLIEAKGLCLEDVEQQLQRFTKGVAPLNVVDAATVGKGITRIENTDDFVELWEKELKSGLEVTKFVPASGAATRMFKDLFAFMNKPEPYPERESVKTFFKKVESAAFYEDLSDYVENLEINDDNYFKRLVSRLLDKSGLGYGVLPKGLIKFHKYADGSRTPFEEHLVEGLMYAARSNGEVHIHFTVSSEHRVLFEKLEKKVVPSFEKKHNLKFKITYSEQKASTDTIAVDMDNAPFREDDKILFRPGGHGALIENLNEVDGDVIFIKNIDNVVPDNQKEATILYKKVIAGKLMALRKSIFAYLESLDTAKEDDLAAIVEFFACELYLRVAESYSNKSFEDKKSYLYNLLNRPIRVCGMVKNEGEPGGGPFIVEDQEGTRALQIAEMNQIDMSNEKVKNMVEEATHFNPVDLVCSVKDYKGNKFNLKQFVDPETAFISLKSKDGKDLKALEHPGLWNGAMAKWNTLFVEVPIETFNPVKEVNDLFRPQHQGM